MNKHGQNFLNLLEKKNTLIKFNQEREIIFNLGKQELTMPVIELKIENFDTELLILVQFRIQNAILKMVSAS